MSYVSRLVWGTVASCLILTGCGHSDAPVAPAPQAVAANGPAEAPRLSWRVVQSYPHDPDAFTQGLLWHDGYFYEGTGLEGKSSVRRVAPITGQVEQKVDVPYPIFGEGLALVNDKLYEISWKNNLCLVYDLQDFKLKRRFIYQGEGWGLTFDGTSLIQSDGSATLTFRDPVTFGARRSVDVTWDGNPVRNLNELEYVNGDVWANIWQTDKIVIIDPATGKVKSYLDLTGLLPASSRRGNEDVLNGIAYDAKSKKVYVTGKLWPKLFWIDVSGPAA